jgi:DNA repair exonuclease SbcCD ATPase subunit
MSLNLEQVKQQLNQRRAELQEEIEVTLPRVEQIEGQLTSLREELARLEDQRDVLASYGKRHIAVPNPHPGTLPPELGRIDGFELEPFRSAKTGHELANEFQRDKINPVRDEIHGREREAQTLLGRRTRGR